MENQLRITGYGSWQNDYSAAEAAYKLGIDPSGARQCVHAIKVKGCRYEIGVCKRKDGTGYSLVWDFWGTGKNIDKVIGDGGQKLLVEYQKEHLKTFAEESGFTFEMNVANNETNIEMG